MKYEAEKAKSIDFIEKVQDIESLRRVALAMTEALFEAIEALEKSSND